MTHVHLPKLDVAGFVRRDRAAHEVRKGPHYDEIRPLLRSMDDRADELPDGWL